MVPRMLNFRPRRRTRSREGYVLTVMLVLFVLPLLLFAGLGLLQWNSLKTVQQRLLAAAERGALCGCCCQHQVVVTDPASVAAGADSVHEGAGLTLGYLGGDYKTEVQFIDTNADTIADEVQVGVTIPLSAASTNYLGLLCGIGVDNVRMRAVARRSCN